MLKKLLILIILVLFLGTLFYFFAYQSQTKELSELKTCKDNNCFQEYFENYTLQNGAVQAIALFKQIISEDPGMESNCHYMFHGIGHGSFLQSGKDMRKAFILGSTTDVLMNIPTCGNGYYHGVIEELVGEISDNQEIATKLKNICTPILRDEPSAAIDCYHGLGHAILTQVDGNVQKAVKVCDQVTDNPKMQSMCHTGVFMEMLRGEKNQDNLLSFEKCLTLPDDLQKAECFNQHSYLLDDFLSKKDAFIKNMKVCEKNVQNMEEKIICIRRADL